MIDGWHDLSDKQAYTVNAYASVIDPDNGYWQLVKDSAALLVSYGHGIAEYAGGWTSTTLWEYPTPTGRRCSIIVRPYAEDKIDVRYLDDEPLYVRANRNILKEAHERVSGTFHQRGHEQMAGTAISLPPVHKCTEIGYNVGMSKPLGTDCASTGTYKSLKRLKLRRLLFCLGYWKAQNEKRRILHGS